MVKIETSTHEIPVSDGSRMNVYLASPRGARSAPAILILQEAFGVNAHIRDVADRFAQQGYVAAAPELYHRKGPGIVGDYNNIQAMMPLVRTVTPECMRLDTRATHDWLVSMPAVDSSRVASIGFCMGGRASFIANASLPLRSAISYYGGGIGSEELLPLANEQKAPLLLIWGGKDKHIPADQRFKITEALTRAGKVFVNTEFSDADHGFFCDERSAYHPVAAKEAWALTQAFLRNHLKLD